jgi:acyl-CoA reductase-like NAD-dependent aldehyde dehydrogenase
MYNAGQSCCAIERVYVHEGIYDQFVESCVSISNDYVLGNPLEMSTTMGPIAQSHHIRFLESQIEQAVDFGAKVLIGGKSCKDESGKGRFFQPTVLVNCNHNMSVMMDETFGPILPIMKVASEQEAIEVLVSSILPDSCRK